jgi:hypothetical protein
MRNSLLAYPVLMPGWFFADRTVPIASQSAYGSPSYRTLRHGHSSSADTHFLF